MIVNRHPRLQIIPSVPSSRTTERLKTGQPVYIRLRKPNGVQSILAYLCPSRRELLCSRALFQCNSKFLIFIFFSLRTGCDSMREFDSRELFLFEFSHWGEGQSAQRR